MTEINIKQWEKKIEDFLQDNGIKAVPSVCDGIIILDEIMTQDWKKLTDEPLYEKLLKMLNIKEISNKYSRGVFVIWYKRNGQ